MEERDERVRKKAWQKEGKEHGWETSWQSSDRWAGQSWGSQSWGADSSWHRR